MWLRMAAAGWEFAFLGETLGAYRIHGAIALGRVRAAAGAGLRAGNRDRLAAEAGQARVSSTDRGRASATRRGCGGSPSRARRRELADHGAEPDAARAAAACRRSARCRPRFAPIRASCSSRRVAARRREPARAAGRRPAEGAGAPPRREAGRMKVAILAGGRRQPDPGGDGDQAEADGRDRRPPILWHIMKLYAHCGLQRVRDRARLQGRLHQALDDRVLVAPGRPDDLAEGREGRRSSRASARTGRSRSSTRASRR